MARNDFTMDPNLLVSVIKAQAGTLNKALLEGVMNSIDAGATRVDVSVTQTEFTISDDGKGFVSEDEIRTWFGRFGTPHQEGDSIYGRFRMGRGQLMSFAQCVWRSSGYEMAVDIEKQGLSYDLRTELPDQKGCSVKGVLYRPLHDYQLVQTVTGLKEMIAYAPVPVYINGELAGRAPGHTKSWSHVDELAFYRLDPELDELSVYNQGVLVEKRDAWSVGVGGVIVSKKPLEVNFARNSILESQCEVWQAINERLERLSARKLTGAGKISRAQRRFLARRLARLPEWGVDALDVKVLTDPTGKHQSIKQLANYERLVHVDDDESLACTIHGREKTFVVNNEMLGRFGVNHTQELLAALKRAPGAGTLLQHLTVVDLEQFSALGLGAATVLEFEGLRPRERAALTALKWLNSKVAQELINQGLVSRERDIRVGQHKANTFVAWTDGASYITANKKFLKLFETGLDGIHTWQNTLVHEYMHDNDDSESHAHGETFYRKFHDAVMRHNAQFGQWVRQGLVVYLSALQEQGLAKPQVLTRQLKSS